MTWARLGELATWRLSDCIKLKMIIRSLWQVQLSNRLIRALNRGAENTKVSPTLSETYSHLAIHINKVPCLIYGIVMGNKLCVDFMINFCL